MSASCPKASDPHSLNHAALRTFPRPRENIGSHFSSQGRWFDPSTAHRIREQPRLRAANDPERPRDPEEPHHTENPKVTAVPGAKKRGWDASYAELDLSGCRLGQQEVNSFNH